MVYTRKDVSTLTRSERRRLVNALLELKRRGEYDAFVRTHIDYYTPDGEGGLRAAHMSPSFLPWHRRFLLDLENALLSMVDHYESYVTPLAAARAAVDELGPDEQLGTPGERDSRTESGTNAAEGEHRHGVHA